MAVSARRLRAAADRKHDRRIGRIGDFTDHLCPCPSILLSTLPEGREGNCCKRWQDRSVAPDYRDPVAYHPPFSNVVLDSNMCTMLIDRVISRQSLSRRSPRFHVLVLAGESTRIRSPHFARMWPSLELPRSRGSQYTERAWAEDRATRGRDPSAVPGAKTGESGTMPLPGFPGLALKR